MDPACGPAAGCMFCVQSMLVLFLVVCPLPVGSQLRLAYVCLALDVDMLWTSRCRLFVMHTVTSPANGAHAACTLMSKVSPGDSCVMKHLKLLPHLPWAANPFCHAAQLRGHKPSIYLTVIHI